MTINKASLIDKIRHSVSNILVASILTAPFVFQKQQAFGLENNLADCSFQVQLPSYSKFLPEVDVGGIGESTQSDIIPGEGDKFRVAPFATIKYDNSVMNNNNNGIFDYGIGISGEMQVQNIEGSITPSFNIGYERLIGNPKSQGPKLAIGSTLLGYADDLLNIYFLGGLESSNGMIFSTPLKNNLNLKIGALLNLTAGVHDVRYGYNYLRPLLDEEVFARFDVLNKRLGAEVNLKIKNPGNEYSILLYKNSNGACVGIETFFKTPKGLSSYNSQGANMKFTIPVQKDFLNLSFGIEHSNWNHMSFGNISLNYGVKFFNKNKEEVCRSEFDICTRANDMENKSLPLQVIRDNQYQEQDMESFITNNANINNFYSKYASNITDINKLAQAVANLTWIYEFDINNFSFGKFVIGKIGFDSYQKMKNSRSPDVWLPYYNEYNNYIITKKNQITNWSSQNPSVDSYDFLHKLFSLNSQGLTTDDKALFDSLNMYTIDCSERALIYTDFASHTNIQGLESFIIACPYKDKMYGENDMHAFAVFTQGNSAYIQSSTSYKMTSVRSSKIENICDALSEIEGVNPIAFSICNKDGKYQYTLKTKNAKYKLVKGGDSQRLLKSNLNNLTNTR